ncbi:MAG: EF-hand domain-containing protein [Pseudomonadota bacterium]
MFERLDTDGDGTITREEFAAAREGRRGHGRPGFGRQSN